MRNNEGRPDLEALWKNFAMPEPAPAEVRQGPAVSVGAIHGPVLSIVTNQPLQIADLWAKTCESPRDSGRGAK